MEPPEDYRSDPPAGLSASLARPIAQRAFGAAAAPFGGLKASGGARVGEYLVPTYLALAGVS